MNRLNELKGLDKDVAERIAGKYDPALEQKAIDWIAAIIGGSGPQVFGSDGSTLYKWLKNGVILCRMINAVKPNIIQYSKVVPAPKHVLEERQNIEMYLSGCVKLGVPSQDMFTLSDLHSGGSMSAVLQNIYAVGRQAQVTAGFKGPILGVKYSVSIEEQQRRLKAKEEEKKRQEEKAKEIDARQLKRRVELEDEKREEIIQDMISKDKRVLNRKLSKGSISKAQFKKLLKDSDEKFENLKNSNEEIVQNSDIRYGMDIEIHQKRKQSYSLEHEEHVMNWIEKVTGEEVDDFYEDLKSGVVLCKLLNCIYPNSIPKYSDRDLPLVHRDNIGMYIATCTRLRVPQMFNVNDLYEKKDLAAVVNHLFALSTKSSHAPFYRGPILELDGTITRLPKPDSIRNFKGQLPPPGSEDRQTCTCNLL